MQEELQTKIGTKEAESLQPAMVEIMGVSIVEVGPNKLKKVECLCKYPAKDKPVTLSAGKHQQKDKLISAGLWFKLDEDGLIMKNSCLASFLRTVGVETLAEVTGRQVMTATDDKGYLVFKCY